MRFRRRDTRLGRRQSRSQSLSHTSHLDPHVHCRKMTIHIETLRSTRYRDHRFHRFPRIHRCRIACWRIEGRIDGCSKLLPDTRSRSGRAQTREVGTIESLVSLECPLKVREIVVQRATVFHSDRLFFGFLPEMHIVPLQKPTFGVG